MADMTITKARIRMSAAQIIYDGTDLGATGGASTFTYTQTWTEFIPDQTTMVEKHFLTEERATLVVTLAEYTIDQMAIAIKTGTQVDDSGGVKKKLHVGGGTFDADSDYKQVVVTAISGGSGQISTNLNLSVTLFKALSTNAVPIGFAKDGARLIEVTFEAVRDSTQTAGFQLFLLGDTSATA